MTQLPICSRFGKYLRNLVFPVFLVIIGVKSTIAQTRNWQQKVDFVINVTLIDSLQLLQGNSTITYTNNSNDTLTFIWFHIWPNAYENDSTAFSNQLLAEGNTQLYFSKANARGYTKPLQFTQADASLFLEWHPKYSDVVKVYLHKPILPKASTQILVNFITKLPENISRGGYTGQTFQACQWFPKPAVYDADGWHPMPYLSSGEFYSNFGNYDVTIQLPNNYLIAATGNLMSQDKIELLQKLAAIKPAEQPNAKAYNVTWRKMAKQKKITRWQAMPPSSSTVTQWRYKAENVIDFAWFASKLFLVQQDTMQQGSKLILLQSMYHPWDASWWQQSPEFAKRAVRFYSQQVGDYPYTWLNIVAGNEVQGSGGMEYPGATLITSSASAKELDEVIAHEIGHNWFQAALATNERAHPWLDEGLNSYFDKKYIAKNYPSKSKGGKWPHGVNELTLLLSEKLGQGQPINSSSTTLTPTNYGLVAYEKTALWLQNLQAEIGEQNLLNAFRQYYTNEKFSNPSPNQFRQALMQNADTAMIKKYWNLLGTSGSLSANIRSKQQLTFLGSSKQLYTTQYHSIVPVIAGNAYDGFGLGVGIHNYQFNLPRWQYFVLPYYSFRSKQLNGAARISYNTYTNKYRFHAGASVTTFTADNFRTDEGAILQQRVIRFVPSVQYVKYVSPFKTYHKWWVQARLFFLQEQQLNFSGTTVATTPNNYNVAQIQAGISNQRTLYPYSVVGELEQGKGFVRAAITAKQFFQYAQSPGGLHVRVFAGKFIYTVPNTFLNQALTSRFHLQMTGPRGNEDYTYSSYYRGRNDFEGVNSQQLMERDGFFKVGTDLLASKVGRSDNWLLATNLVADIPAKWNPLSRLPIPIPLKLYADIGTHAEAWENVTANGRFLYNAGIQISIANETVNIYIPILMSRVYRDYFQSTASGKTFQRSIAFEIRLPSIKTQSIAKQLLL